MKNKKYFLAIFFSFYNNFFGTRGSWGRIGMAEGEGRRVYQGWRLISERNVQSRRGEGLTKERDGDWRVVALHFAGGRATGGKVDRMKTGEYYLSI